MDVNKAGLYNTELGAEGYLSLFHLSVSVSFSLSLLLWILTSGHYAPI